MLGAGILGQANMDQSRIFQTVGCGLLLVHEASFMSLPSIRRNIQNTENKHQIFIKAEHCYIKIVDISPICFGIYYVHNALKLNSLVCRPTEKLLCCRRAVIVNPFKVI
jgi:hypothetical protein